MQIGNVKLENRLVLAPMAGVTDLPFRLLCREQGAGLVCMEMVSAKALSYHNKNTERLLEVEEREHPVSLQLFGSDPGIISDMAREMEDRPFDILDLNMGCPVPKVVNNGEGSALLRNPRLIEEIVSQVSRAIAKPVTAKIRIGIQGATADVTEIAKRVEEGGAAAIAVHGRTREQYYSGYANWEAIARVKEAISIPVIGNGDIDSPEAAKRMFQETGCDGIMIGRAARGNPWIFSEMNHYFATGERLLRPSYKDIGKMILRHASEQIVQKGEYTGIREMRRHVAWYTAGMPHSARLRREMNQVESYAQLEALLASLLLSEPDIQ